MSTYDKFPVIEIEGKTGYEGWDAVAEALNKTIDRIAKNRKIIVLECYQGVNDNEIRSQLQNKIPHSIWVESAAAFKPEDEIKKMAYPDVTDDAIFGFMTRLNMQDFFDAGKLTDKKNDVDAASGTIVVYGPGASLVAENFDLLVYFDMARWEIQLRMRRNEVNNLGVQNKNEAANLQYKQGFFVDWRVCDRLKKKLFHQIGFLVDTNQPGNPKMVSGADLLYALEQTAQRPFRVMPFFDPGPWGGQWMKEVCNLDRSEENFAWAFDCVPEENSLLLGFGGVVVEIPSVNLVFLQPEKLLGPKVYSRFGDEFPIRFDLLDTWDGGNLSLQVHPLTEYVQEKFGMRYTQEESYYYLDAKEGSVIYLGFKEGVNKDEMIHELNEAQKGNLEFETEKYVNAFPAKKHDHMAIPPGTIHCSGANSVVLEISATPYIFTFKLWDWGRMGLDGKPRPINIEHGKNVLQWNRDTNWVKEHALNLVKKVDEGDGYVEESTGLNEREFIETRRHWFTKKVLHHTHNNLNVLNLVEGDAVVVESPENNFAPFTVHYAETFIVPAFVGAYTIRPLKEDGRTYGTIKAYVRG